jgi:hypothetical protein
MVEYTLAARRNWGPRHGLGSAHCVVHGCGPRSVLAGLSNVRDAQTLATVFPARLAAFATGAAGVRGGFYVTARFFGTEKQVPEESQGTLLFLGNWALVFGWFARTSLGAGTGRALAQGPAGLAADRHHQSAGRFPAIRSGHSISPLTRFHGLWTTRGGTIAKPGTHVSANLAHGSKSWRAGASTP